jgi:hypothetical protein
MATALSKPDFGRFQRMAWCMPDLRLTPEAARELDLMQRTYGAAAAPAPTPAPPPPGGSIAASAVTVVAFGGMTEADAQAALQGLETRKATTAALTAGLGGKQPLDATLTAIAGATNAANKLGYWAGVDSYALTDFTPFARTLLDDADAATMRGTLGIGSGTGDVVGPGVAVNNRVAFFDGTTGKLIKDSGLTLAGSNTGDQSISITGDGTASGSTGALALTVTKINGVSLAGLATGILKNTTGTGVPSIAGAADFPTLNQNTTGSAATLTTPRNIDGQAFNGSADISVIAPATHAAASKTTPVDADEMPLADSAATFGLKRLTWANLKATLKAYFDTLYQAAGSYLVSGGALGTPASGTLTNATGLPIASGVSGLAAGVAAFLATPTSANLAAALTDENGTGTNVFSTAPDITSIKMLGTIYRQQGAQTSLAAAATLTIAQLLTGIIQYTGAAATLTLPTGTLIDAGILSGLAVDRAFQFSVINTGSGTATLATATGLTLVGSMAVALGTSATFRVRKTAANTFTVYRL